MKNIVSVILVVTAVVCSAHGWAEEAAKGAVRTDQKSIQEGKILFGQKCAHCHDPESKNKIVGPGLKGILKEPLLPVSKKPATPENVASQMRHPLSNMPSFIYLSEDEVLNIVGYLNTL